MAEDDDDFDPDAFIETPGEPELDEEAKAAIRAAQAQERAEFEQAARKGKFDDFNRTETRVTSGTFHFRVRQRELQEVLATVGLTASKRNPHFSCMKVIIFRTMLKICTFNPGVFSEYFLWLVEPSPSIPFERDQDLAVAFVFEHATLWRIASKFPAETLDFSYNVERQTLAIQTRDPFNPTVIQKDFLLSCLPLTDFTDYHTKLPPDPGPDLLGEVHAGLLRKVVEYAALFAQKNETQAQFNCATMYQGRFYAGTHRDMGAIGAPELQPLNFSVKFESISTLGKMLAHFVPEQTSLWVNPTWYLLTDGVLFFGFERYQVSLPVPDVFQKKSADYCLVPRKQLTESVALLAAVEKDSDARVEIAVPGESGPTQMFLKVPDRLGKPCSDWVIARRDQNAGETSTFPAWHFSVPVVPLLKVTIL